MLTVEMQAVDTNARFDIKKILFKGDIIFELEILFQLLRLKDELLLGEVDDQGKKNDTSDDIPDEMRQDR
jgi:hypothetical protein